MLLRFWQVALPASTRAAIACPALTSSDRATKAGETLNASMLAASAANIETRAVTIITLGAEVLAAIRAGYRRGSWSSTHRLPL